MQKLGIYLLLAGIIVAVGYGIYCFFAFAFQSMPIALKIAIVAVGVGLLFILASLIKERVKASKEEEEKFKGVEK
jgi:multisubunit Na+/H+ antiporter MnhC subunit